MADNNPNEKVDDLILKLKSSELDVRQQAAYDLHKIGEEKVDDAKKAIPALIEAINDEDWAVRKMSILALGELDAKEFIPRFIEFLKNDDNPEVRVGAAEALGDLKAEQAVEALVKALDDSYAMLAQVAMWSLGQLGIKAKKALPKIIEIMMKPEDIELVQINDLAAWALGEIGDKSAIEPLTKALNSAAYHERKYTIAYSLALLEGKNGKGYAELLRMKENHEFVFQQLDEFNSLEKKLK